MAPEVVLGESYDSSADVYSFAVLMFAMSCDKGDAYGAFTSTVEAENAYAHREEDNDRGAMSSASVMAKVANDDLRPDIAISIKFLKVSERAIV
jgi:serine/threonine protein kinase